MGEIRALVQPQTWFLGSVESVVGEIVSVRVGTLGHGQGGWCHYGHGEWGWGVEVGVCEWLEKTALRLRETVLTKDDLGDKDDWQPWDAYALALRLFWGFLGDAGGPISGPGHSDLQIFDHCMPLAPHWRSFWRVSDSNLLWSFYPSAAVFFQEGGQGRG